MLLPDPLSPTMPRLSPLPMSKLMLVQRRHRGRLPAAPLEDLAKGRDGQHSGCLQATRWSEANRRQRRRRGVAVGLALPAARREAARQQRRRQIGKLALYDVKIVGRAGMLRRGGQKLGRVGVARGPDQRRDRRALDDLTRMHHHDAMAVRRGKRKVVGDEQRGHAPRARQIRNQFHDGRLGRDVQAGGRLVRDEQFGLACQREGDADALALPSRQLERVVARLACIEPHALAGEP